MQKVIRFLEAHVEWLALGIAVLFLGWTVYTYLIGDPVAVKLDNTEVSPANIDTYIDTHAAQRLREKFDPNATPPNFTVEPFVDAIKSKITLDPTQPTELAGTAFDYAPFDASNVTGPAQKMGQPVLQLPTLPPAQPLLAAAALDTIAPPQAANPPAAAAVAGGGAAPVAGGKDVRLVVAAFTIPWSDLFAQWESSFGPPKIGQQPRLAPAEFQILAVTAYRSEKIGDTWSKDEQISILNGADLPAYPKAGNKNDQTAYLLALAKNPKTVASPDFPTVSAGVVWKDPIQLLPGAANQPGAPGIPGTPDQNGGAMRNPDQRFRTVNTADSLAGTQLAQYRGGFGGPGGYQGGYSGPGGPRPNYIPQPETPAEQAPPQPTIIPPAPGTVDPVLALVNPKTAPNPLPTLAPSTKLNLLAAPAKSPDLYLYIIDQSADTGKTYRYRITYKTLNPLYNKASQHAAQGHQAWILQFDLESKVSNYSPEITVPTQTYFFCGKSQNSQGLKNAFPFEVFTWNSGKWQKGTFNAGLGDPIGGLDGTIDYSTGWTYVDQRHARGNKMLITLVDNDGNVDIRDASQDSTSADYKKTTQWVEQTKNGPPQAGQLNPSPYGSPLSPYPGNNLQPGIPPPPPE